MSFFVALAALKPTPPVISGVALGTTSISIALVTPSTEPQTGISGYQLFRRLTGDFAFTQIQTLQANQFPYVDTGLTANFSYDYQCRGVDNGPQRDVSGPSLTITLRTDMTPVTGATKFRSGHGVWFDNTYWPGNQQPAYNAAINSIGTDPTGPSLICIYLHWSAMEGAAGDYSAGFAIVDSILAKLSSYSRPLYLHLRSITRTFDGSLANSTDYWPAYACALSPAGNNKSIQGGNGWIVNVAKGSNPPLATSSQINIGRTDTPHDSLGRDVNQAYTAVWKAYAARYDSHPNMEVFCPFDESIQFNGSGTVNNITPEAFYAAFKKLHLDVKASAPTTFVQCAVNFLNDFSNGAMTAPQQFADLFAMSANHPLYPGGICFGGPDPTEIGTTAQQAWRGAVGGGPDYRGKLTWIDMLQGVPVNGTSGSPSNITVQKLAAYSFGPTYPGFAAQGSPATNGHAYYMIWNQPVNYWVCNVPPGSASNQNNYAVTNGQLSIIHAMNNTTQPGVPSIGSYVTNPGNSTSSGAFVASAGFTVTADTTFAQGNLYTVSRSTGTWLAHANYNVSGGTWYGTQYLCFVAKSFENGQYQDNGLTWNTGGAVWDVVDSSVTAPPVNSTKCARQRGQTSRQGELQCTPGINPTYLYSRFDFKYGSTYNGKNWRSWGDTNSIYIATNVTDGSRQLTGSNDQADDVFGSPNQYSASGWNTVETYTKVLAPSQLFQTYLNTKLQWARPTGVQPATDWTPGNMSGHTVDLGNLLEIGDTGYFANYVVDFSPQVFFMTDASTLAASTRREMQIPVQTCTTTSWRHSFNLGQFASRSGRFFISYDFSSGTETLIGHWT